MNKQSILQYVDKKYQKSEASEFKVGDTVKVHVKITEGNSTRIQIFEGIVVSMKGHGGTRTFTVRKISFNIGVERVFPLNSPAIEKISVVRSGQTRRAKLYYLRDRMGRAAKLEEKETLLSDSKGSVPSTVLPIIPPVELVTAKEK